MQNFGGPNKSAKVKDWSIEIRFWMLHKAAPYKFHIELNLYTTATAMSDSRNCEPARTPLWV